MINPFMTPPIEYAVLSYKNSRKSNGKPICTNMIYYKVMLTIGWEINPNPEALFPYLWKFYEVS